VVAELAEFFEPDAGMTQKASLSWRVRSVRGPPPGVQAQMLPA
jgi:hypothetical protein